MVYSYADEMKKRRGGLGSGGDGTWVDPNQPNKPNPQNTVLPAFDPGQLGALSRQLNAGYGGSVQDWRQDLQNTYSPAVIKPFNYGGGPNNNGNGQNHNGNGNNGDDRGGGGDGITIGDPTPGHDHSKIGMMAGQLPPPPPPPPRPGMAGATAGFGLLSGPSMPTPPNLPPQIPQGILSAMQPPPPPPPQMQGGVQGVQGIQGLQSGGMGMFGGNPPSMSGIPPEVLAMLRQRMMQGGR